MTIDQLHELDFESHLLDPEELPTGFFSLYLFACAERAGSDDGR